MSIVRVNKEDKYFSASNEPFNDERLLWETRGLIGYLLSKPNHWTIRFDDLLKHGPGRRDKVRKMLRDAQVHGYLNRQRVTRQDGTFYWLWDLYESPSLNPTRQTSGGFSVSGEPVTDLPQVEKPVTGKPTDVVITDKANTESDDEGTPPAPNIYTLYEQNIGALTPLLADTLKDAEQTYPQPWIADAMLLAVKNNKRNWKYCEAILRRWNTEGKDDGQKPAKPNGRHNTKETPLERYQREQGYA